VVEVEVGVLDVVQEQTVVGVGCDVLDEPVARPDPLYRLLKVDLEDIFLMAVEFEHQPEIGVVGIDVEGMGSTCRVVSLS